MEMEVQRETEMREELRELPEEETETQRGLIAELNATDAGGDMATVGGERCPSGDTYLAVAGPSTRQGEGPVKSTGTEIIVTKKSERLSNVQFDSLDGSPPPQGPSVTMRGGLECDEEVSELVERVDSVLGSSGNEADSVHGSPIKKEEEHVKFRSLRDLVEASTPEYADVGKDG
jgi:hypothetical protein